jgi:tetratricopeptide (TPR) repeat protein
MPEKQNVLKVMVSSTIVDLPKHRDEVQEACLRQGMLPKMMEHQPASDEEAITFSLRLVDESDIYLGVFAHRYGYVPKHDNPDQISMTEMEYNRAVELKMPRLIFIMDKAHPITIDDVDQGENAVKLKTFLDKVKPDNFVKFFKSPGDLRAEVINSLAAEKVRIADKNQPDPPVPNPEAFHYVSEIPDPPETYIAHPYTLLQTHGLIGRQEELNFLTDWVAKPESKVYKAHILGIVAIGGMGKSALTWKWFNDIAPEEMKPLAGRMWWSFYEPGATFDNFIVRALAYITHKSVEEIWQLSEAERENQLLAALDQKPFLIVLDGLERILIAYADPRSEEGTISDRKKLRRIVNPEAGSLLKKFRHIRNSRILLNTRLFPSELENEAGEPMPGSDRHPLDGLADKDAVELWRAFGVSGSRDLLLPIFNTFAKHPLLIQALAGEVKRYRKAPGDFEKWLTANPTFDPVSYQQLRDAMSHVLEFALIGLDDTTRRVLQIIGALRLPAQYETLTALLVGKEKLCPSEQQLDKVFTELEDRGLVGWDKQTNRYHLHPIVRGVVWGGLGDEMRKGVYTNLHMHFEAMPIIDDWKKVHNLEDLTTTIELYYTLIGLGRYEDALPLYFLSLSDALFYRLNASGQVAELLKMLFPDGPDKLPRLRNLGDQALVINDLAASYYFCGQPVRSIPLFCISNAIQEQVKDNYELSLGLQNLTYAQMSVGALVESERSMRQALAIARESNDRFRESEGLGCLGMIMTTRGMTDKAKLMLNRALYEFIKLSNKRFEGVMNFKLACLELWLDQPQNALSFANRAMELAPFHQYERDLIRSLRICGQVALRLNDFTKAEELLQSTLTRARSVNLVEDELTSLIELAELRRKQKNEIAARELLDDVWEYAERGPYPLLHSDALNVLVQIERDAGNKDKAIEAATKAYKLAWCDGPPYAYHWGLIKAQKHLEELGAQLPEMPPFDESKFEPMPDVEIGPDDEFHVGDLEE